MMAYTGLAGRALRWLFSTYFRRKEERVMTEMRKLGRKLFAEDKLKAVFPFFSIRQKGENGQWSVRVDGRGEIYLLFNILPRSGIPVARYAAGRVFSSVKVDRRDSLILEEYRHPSVKRWRPDGEEVRIARALLRRGDLSCEILLFYMRA